MHFLVINARIYEDGVSVICRIDGSGYCGKVSSTFCDHHKTILSAPEVLDEDVTIMKTEDVRSVCIRKEEIRTCCTFRIHPDELAHLCGQCFVHASGCEVIHYAYAFGQ